MHRGSSRGCRSPPRSHQATSPHSGSWACSRSPWTPTPAQRPWSEVTPPRIHRLTDSFMYLFVGRFIDSSIDESTLRLTD
jgi:hypothetical protein